MRFSPYCIMLALWSFLIYAPFCHWVWGAGGRELSTLQMEPWSTSAQVCPASVAGGPRKYVEKDMGPASFGLAGWDSTVALLCPPQMEWQLVQWPPLAWLRRPPCNLEGQVNHCRKRGLVLLEGARSQGGSSLQTPPPSTEQATSTCLRLPERPEG